MSKCNPVPYHKVEKMLRKNSYERIRTNGGHEICRKLNSQITIPAHGDVQGVIVRRIVKENELVMQKGQVQNYGNEMG